MQEWHVYFVRTRYGMNAATFVGAVIAFYLGTLLITLTLRPQM